MKTMFINRSKRKSRVHKKSRVKMLACMVCALCISTLLMKEIDLLVYADGKKIIMVMICGMLLGWLCRHINNRKKLRIKAVVVKTVLVIMSALASSIFIIAFRSISKSFWIKMILVLCILLSGIGINDKLGKFLEVHLQRKRILGKDFSDMTGWEFEQYCAVWLGNRGFQEIKVTSGSGDYGADVLCKRNGLKYAVQCKLYSGKVPYRAVEEVICARQYYGADKAMIFTNSVLTPQASEAASKLGVIVYDEMVVCR